METGLTKNRIISELTRSPHGALGQYLPIGLTAAKQEPEFLAHLIAWNQDRGQVRDSKVALPVIGLTAATDDAITENALAHIAMLDPRNLVRAVRFVKEVKPQGNARKVTRLVERYLRTREKRIGWFDRAVVQHRASMKELYALCHIKPNTRANDILFKGKKVGVFKKIAELKDMPAGEAAGVILTERLPFLVVQGALGAKAKEPALVLAMLTQMSASEVVNHVKMLEKLGVKTVPELRAVFEQKLQEAASSKVNTFKATRAAEAVTDKALSEKLKATQEKQLAALGGIDGNWLVLGDKSGSMAQSIETARHVAATLAKMVKGEVHLIFFDSSPRYVNATGKTYDALLAETRMVTAGGGTSIGCGLQYAVDKGLDIGGIAVISDGGENQAPAFATVYEKLTRDDAKTPPVYFYQVDGDSDSFSRSMSLAGIDLQTFDLKGGQIDYYGLPNIVQTMRANRYSLIDEVMATPLKKVADVLTVVDAD